MNSGLGTVISNRMFYFYLTGNCLSIFVGPESV